MSEFQRLEFHSWKFYCRNLGCYCLLSIPIVDDKLNWHVNDTQMQWDIYLYMPMFTCKHTYAYIYTYKHVYVYIHPYHHVYTYVDVYKHTCPVMYHSNNLYSFAARPLLFVLLIVLQHRIWCNAWMTMIIHFQRKIIFWIWVIITLVNSYVRIVLVLLATSGKKFLFLLINVLYTLSWVLIFMQTLSWPVVIMQTLSWPLVSMTHCGCYPKWWLLLPVAQLSDYFAHWLILPFDFVGYFTG